MAEEAARWLDREALAAYISVRVDEVQRLLRAGKLPTPVLPPRPEVAAVGPPRRGRLLRGRDAFCEQERR